MKKQFFPLFALFWLSLNFQFVSASDQQIGNGTIAIIVMIGISFIICLCSRGTTSPLLISFIGALLPVITFIILYAYPKETNTTDKTQDSRVCCDFQYRYRIAYTVIFFILAILFILWRLKLEIFTSHYARKAAFGYKKKAKDEINEEQELSKMDLVKEDEQGLLEREQLNEDRDFSNNQGPSDFQNRPGNFPFQRNLNLRS